MTMSTKDNFMHCMTVYERQTFQLLIDDCLKTDLKKLNRQTFSKASIWGASSYCYVSKLSIVFALRVFVSSFVLYAEPDLQGDGNIRYFEMVNESPYCHFLSQYQSGSPQRSLGEPDGQCRTRVRSTVLRIRCIYCLNTLRMTYLGL